MRNPEQPVVVDSSVIIKWFLEEPYSDEARTLLASDQPRITPDLAFSEIGNILWKRTRIGDSQAQITREEANAFIIAVRLLPIAVRDSRPLLSTALEIACQTERTFYDSLYLALAVKENAVFVTADEKLVNALQSTPIAPYVEWLGQTLGKE